MGKTLEICCDQVTSAINASKGGADRIELCENLAQGGVTPSAGKIKLVKENLTIPVFVLIRPRKADFLYNDLEFQLMLSDIAMCKSLGVDGIVSGILEADGSFDLPRMKAMVELAHPLPFTCHRAFDMCKDPNKAIKELSSIGVKRILTSGQQPNALLGMDNLIQYAQIGVDQGIKIMACGGLLPNNIERIASIETIEEFHSAPNHTIHSQMAYKGITPMGDEAADQEFAWQEVDETLVRDLKAALM